MAEAVSGYAVVKEDRDGAHIVKQTKQPEASSPADDGGAEQRWVPSQAAGDFPIVPYASPPTGEFFHKYQQFNYTNPDGTHVEIKIVGVGSLQGTFVDSSGALHLLFSKTNSYTRILSNVHGGTGQAYLASIYSADLYNNSAQTSLSGIGASVLSTISVTSQ